MQPHPDVIEVSFPIPKGLSGAPLVQQWNEPPKSKRNNPPFILLGVCVGNEESEVLAYAHEEVTDGNTTHREKVIKVERYGIVHDLRPLADWKPECWNGATLRETIQYEDARNTV